MTRAPAWCFVLITQYVLSVNVWLFVGHMRPPLQDISDHEWRDRFDLLNLWRFPKKALCA